MRASACAALLAIPFLVATPLPVSAQNMATSTTPFVVPDVDQDDGVPGGIPPDTNINVLGPIFPTNTASTLAMPSLEGLLNVFTATSIAVADMQVVGTAGGPIMVDQQNDQSVLSPTQLNTNTQTIFATAVALTQPISITNDPAGATVALSSATASAGLDAVLGQTNINAFGEAEGVVITQQENFNSQLFVVTAIAVADDVSITSTGPVNTAGNGLSAVSKALTDTGAHIGNTIDQSNSNVSADTDPDGITQVQNLEQTNETEKVMIATDVSVAGDVSISSTGPMTAGGNGFNAETRARSLAEIGSTVEQSNGNNLVAITTSTNDDIIQVQGNGVEWEQENENREISVATAVSVAGNVHVDNDGDVDADENGTNAVADSDADATINNGVTQSNGNILRATVSSNNSDITQIQGNVAEWEQENENTEIGVATSVAVAGDVEVFNTGKTKADLNGFNAVSNTNANATIDSTVRQFNQNTQSATGGDDTTQVQANGGGTWEQDNENFELYVATAVGVSGDVYVTNEGDTFAGENGHNAMSSATATAEIGSGNTVSQINLSSLTGTATLSEGFLDPVPLTQAQGNAGEWEQENENAQVYVSTAVAVAGDVTITNVGDTRAGITGVNAVSNAAATAANNGSVTQSNINEVTGTTGGNGSPITQAQGVGPAPGDEEEWEQENESGQLFVATAVATAGNVTVSNRGDTRADETGFNAVSNATSTASNAGGVTQSNTNTVTGTTQGSNSTITQAQGLNGAEWEQENENTQIYVSTAVAVAGDVVVRNKGDTEAGKNGINAQSTATAGATNNNAVTQTNSNRLTAATTNTGSSITQIQGVGGQGAGEFEQENESFELSFATSIAKTGDVKVWNKGDNHVDGNGVNATSEAMAGPTTVNNKITQSNLNNVPPDADPDQPTAKTTGFGAAITQNQRIGNVEEPGQSNDNFGLLAATSIAEAGDVAAANIGDTVAGASGVNAVSSAYADSSIGNEVAQGNTNNLSAETSGDGSFIAQGGVSLGVFVDLFDDDFTLISAQGGQDVTQSNFNGGIAVATSFAKTGDVAVKSIGDTTASEYGVNASSTATADSTITSGVDQDNVNALSADTSGGSGEIPIISIGVASLNLVTPAIVVQDQNVDQTNFNGEGQIATSVALVGDVAVWRKGGTTADLSGVNAVANADADANVGNTVNQSNDNGAVANTTGDGAFIIQGGLALSVGIPEVADLTFSTTGGQTVGQSNTNAQLGLATSIAGAGDVDVKVHGDTTAGEHAVNATSIATADSTLTNSVTQGNINGLSASTQGEPGDFGAAVRSFLGDTEVTFPLPALIVQDQSVEQSNFNGQFLAATSITHAGDVSVESVGNNNGGISGINAVSDSSATSRLGNTVTQSNDNSADASTTGDGALILQTSATLNLLDIISVEIGGGQDVEQVNTNLQALAATSIAYAGDVEVNVEGNSEGGDTAINATSNASSLALVDSGDSVSQTNTNSLSGNTEGLAAIILQDQTADQSNINGQALIAGAAAFSDHVDVTVTGDSNGGKTGVNAESKAKAVAGVKNSVNQTNENRLGAFTTGEAAIVTQTQDAEQVNFNADLSVAAADAQSEDVTVKYTGNSTGDEKAAINAESKAVALAGVKKSIDQKNINGPVLPPPPDEIEAEVEEPADAEAQIVREPLPEPVIPTGSTEGLLAVLTQTQTAEQINFNGEIVAAASFAQSDDVKVFSDGSHYGGENAIKAKSEAVAGAGVFTEVTQLNDNALNGSATGPLALMLQTQGALQVNANLESGNAVALAFSDTVEVEHWGDLESGKTAIEAASSAEAGAVVVQKANQTNLNSADAVGSLILQLQGALQINANVQDGNAFALAVADDVKVKQSGNTTAGKDGINAKSAADAKGIVVQTAEQLNDNSAHIALGASEDGTGGGSEIPLPDILDGFGVGIQGQLLGQLNVNLQSGTAISTAISKDVKVDSENDPAAENGVVAVSSADALGVVYQDATQTNQNGASIELPTDGLGIGLQVGLGLQANLNGQEGLAVVTARSGDVYVDQDGSLDAGKDGAKAISSAEANGVVFQAVEQNNIDGKTVAPAEPDGTDDQVEDTVFGVGVQLEGVLQANLSGQEGVSVATAKSGKADIDKWGSLVTGEDGLVAVSSAKADAAVIQKADQSNENDLDATGAIVAQIQIPLQLNVSTQRGAAVSTAISDKASVNQSGDMNAGGNGVVAISKAEADAKVVQDATQLNDNSATATLEGELELPDTDPVPTPQLVDDDLIGDLDDPIGLALQIQGGLQINASEQHGVAISTAISDDVKVKSENDPAGGIGVKAASEAEAGAVVFQKADQTNTNNVAATFTAPNVTIPEPGEVVPNDVIEQMDGTDLALQVQLFGQVNLNDQAGLAVATAISDDVEVEQDGTLEAGGDGFNVASDAKAKGGVVQIADQSNTNTATATFEGPSVDITAEGESVDVGVFQTDGLDLALQGQLIGQLNVSTQRGAAISTAISDDVEVEKTGGMTAGADGINARSAADAEGGVFQAASQSNDNSADAMFKGAQADITATAGDGEEDDPDEPIDEDAFVQLSQADGIDIGIQGQAVGQLNVNAQSGAAISTAKSGDVKVKSQDDPAGDNGVVASSDAEANAAVVQTVLGEKTEDGFEPGQSNTNSATATFEGGQVGANLTAEDLLTTERDQSEGLDFVLQGQLVGQINLSGQRGLAVATAISDDVKVDQAGVLDAGKSGIVATSSATAAAPVVQTASQKNDNSATATFEGQHVGGTLTDSRATSVGDETAGLNADVSLQGQLVGQVNLSSQRGAAIATAISDDVEVDQSGSMTVGKDGIVAASSAKAEAPVFQKATQVNENSAEASLFGGVDLNVDRPDEFVVPTQTESADFDLAVQGQLVGQINLSGQRGLAVATAVSDDVKVSSRNDPAGENGVIATSAAKAVAPLVQTATQTNDNSATATFQGAQLHDRIVFNENEDDGFPEPEAAVIPGQSIRFFQDDGSEFALQVQAVGQANLNRQRGLAVATAISDEVYITQSDNLDAGKSGIIAASEAEGTAPVVQTASQSNDNRATATFEGAQAGIDTQTTGSINTTLTQGENPIDRVNQDLLPVIGEGTVNLAVQGQLVGQFNVNSQGAAAVATALSDDVTVKKSGGMNVGDDGIVASSGATGNAAVVQTADQSNSNSATAMLKGDQAMVSAEAGDLVEPDDTTANASANLNQFDGTDVALQGQLVGQANLNVQHGAAIATAVSGKVTVRSQDDPAGGNGVVASSDANAKAAVVQTAVGKKTEDGYEPGQSNENTAAATFGGAQGSVSAGADDNASVLLRQIDGADVALQGQIVGQVNLNRQRGLAVATAVSDDVKAEQAGALDAGKSGMVAASSAKAEAPVFQAASQKNDNSATATFEGSQGGFGVGGDASARFEVDQADGDDVALQGQFVGQLNLSSQGGAAIATALSDDVRVKQSGTMTVGEDGIKAASSAEAIAPVAQTAKQSNVNKAEAMFKGAADAPPAGSSGSVRQTDGADFALQGQLVGQANLSGQRGLAVATAISDDVTVRSQDDPAGGNGVLATSSADAEAPMFQAASQSNKNEAEATFDGAQFGVGSTSDENVNVSFSQVDGSDLALQVQIVGQANLSRQRGLAVATAISDDVEIEQAGDLDVGQSGLIATSAANAKAPVVQTANQGNVNSAKAIYTGSQAHVLAEAQGSVGVDVTQGDEIPVPAFDANPELERLIGDERNLDLAVQGQLVGQVNLNSQGGLAVATAISDDVDIEQSGGLTTGVDGVVGTSSAVADSAMVQTATQSNKNTAEATFGGDQTDITARAGDGEVDDPDEPDKEGVDVSVQRFDGVDVALQGQIVGQANLNRQSGISVATALSDDVRIKSQTDPSGNNGVVGTSSALATAPLVQSADQKNENSATATFEGSQADFDLQAEDTAGGSLGEADGLDLALQGQLVGQINLSGQHGLAVATAISDDVKIEQSGPLETGASGIVGTSSAKAVAPVVQDVTQSNTNTADATFEGTQIGQNTRIALKADPGVNVGLQGQIVGQVNLSGQLGGAVSTAISDDVYVDQSGTMNAGTDGVVAASSADAFSALVQTANQSNANSADQIFEPSQRTFTIGDEQVTRPEPSLDGPNIALQGQLAGQVNLSAQGGLSVATAESGKVKVSSTDDPAGNDGVVADSSSHAGAAVIQTVGKKAEDGEEGEEGEWKDKELEPGQSNVNHAGIALPPEEEENGDAEALANLDGDFGLQVQGALQVNASLQAGAAISTAVSNEVRIDQDGELTTGNNGLVGTSSAVSGALVAQTAVQSNENTAEVAPVEEPLEPIEVVELPDEIELDALTIQGQAIGQLNVNVQAGAAIGLAFSDKVSIHQSGIMDVGGNGVVATSAAAAGAVVAQSADQSNTNTLATAADAPVQGQLFGQLNLNVQEGLAVGVAIADEVEVESESDPAAEAGIIASSTAATLALVDQSAYQSNDNTLDTGDNQAFNGQLGGQLNVSVQKGLAVGVALSDDVSVKQTGDMETGGVGIEATSSSGVLAAVKQDIDQSNTNEAEAPGLAGQANLAEQKGLAVALAGSGKVTVVQKGKLTTGKTAIKAVSSASATAKVEQDEDQYSGVPEDEDHDHYWNEAATAAFAVSDKVSVQSDEIDAGGDGVVGISAAHAKALGGNQPIKLDEALEAAESDELDTVVAENFLLVPPSAFAFAKADRVDIWTKGPIVAAGYGVYAVSYANAEAQAEDGNSLAIAKSDDVNVVVKDDITAGKDAVYAGSIAVANNNGTEGIATQGNITVAIKRGTVTGGNGYYGIRVLGGGDNHISIGEEATVTSLSGHAIFGGDKDETVWNDGMVIGIVDLGLGNNAFFNNLTGSFYTGSLVNLNGGLLTNAGLLSPGGPGVIQTTALNGDLVQTGTGTYYVDIDMGNAVSDRINATGSATLDGTITGKVIANPQTGEQAVTILHADGGANDAGVQATDTALVDYTVGWSGPNDVTLHMDVNFAPMALAKEPWGLGEHLNNVFMGGGPAEMEDLGVALLGLETLGDVENAYWQLSPENYRALSEGTLYAAQQFFQDMNSCKVRDGGVYSVIDEDQCLWARVRWRDLDVGSNSGTSGYNDEAVAILGGAQWNVGGAWHVGLAGGYENTDVSTNSPRVNSDGDRGHLGGTVKYINGPWLASGTIAGGWTGYDSTRQISFPGFAATAKSDQDITNIGGQLRGAYLMTSGKWYAKPQVDLDVIYVDMDGFTETGGGGAALKVSGTDETVFIATPALELGTQWGFNGVLARPFVRGGVSFYSDADFPILAGFAAAPGVAPFKTTGEIDDVVGNISAGVSLLGTGRGVVTLSYDGAFGDDLESHSASAKASWRY